MRVWECVRAVCVCMCFVHTVADALQISKYTLNMCGLHGMCVLSMNDIPTVRRWNRRPNVTLNSNLILHINTPKWEWEEIYNCQPCGFSSSLHGLSLALSLQFTASCACQSSCLIAFLCSTIIMYIACFMIQQHNMNKILVSAPTRSLHAPYTRPQISE